MASFTSKLFLKNCLKYGAVPLTATCTAYWMHQKYLNQFEATSQNPHDFVKITERFSKEPDPTLK